MNAIQVMAALRPRVPEGTAVWASERVMALILDGGGIIDRVQQDRVIRKLQHFCDGNFKTFMPEMVKRECNKTFGVHLDQIRLVGFFDNGYADFIALDWFVKKKRQNDRRMSAIYENVDAIRESGQWQRAE